MSTIPEPSDHPRTEREVALQAELDAANRLIAAFRALGTVFVPPQDWDYPGMGEPPSASDYDEIDLSTFEG